MSEATVTTESSDETLDGRVKGRRQNVWVSSERRTWQRDHDVSMAVVLSAGFAVLMDPALLTKRGRSAVSAPDEGSGGEG